MANNKQFYQTFAWELVRTNSGSQAYLNAVGQTAVTPKQRISANTKAQQLLKNKHVIKYIASIRESQRIGVTEIVDGLADIFRFDPAELLNPDGTVKAVTDMPETARKMISGIKVNELWLGRGADREQYGVVKEIKFINKMEAVEKLMKHLGGYGKDNEQKKAVTQVAIFQLPDNGRGETAVTLDSVTVGEVISYEEVKAEEVEEGNRDKVQKDERETAKAKRGTGVQGNLGNLGSAGSLNPNIGTMHNPNDL